MTSRVTLRGLVRTDNRSKLDVECACGARSALDHLAARAACPNCGIELEVDLAEVVSVLQPGQTA
jgi:hypothetical protein